MNHLYIYQNQQINYFLLLFLHLYLIVFQGYLNLYLSTYSLSRSRSFIENSLSLFLNEPSSNCVIVLFPHFTAEDLNVKLSAIRMPLKRTWHCHFFPCLRMYIYPFLILPTTRRRQNRLKEFDVFN